MQRFHFGRVLNIVVYGVEGMIGLHAAPTKLGLFLVGIRTLNAIFKKDWVYTAHSFFDSWDYFSSQGLGGMIGATLCNYNKTKIAYRWGKDKVAVVKFDRGSLGWIISGDTFADGFYISGINKDEAIEKIRNLCWEIVGTDNAVIIRTGTVSPSNGDLHLKIITDNLNINECFESSAAFNIVNDIRFFSEKRISRSLLFVGPAGTGKSVITRQIARILSARTLRISISELSNISIDFIVNAAALLKPDILILDDLDRSSDLIKLFDGLEQCRNSFGILLATMNNVEKCDPALLRPGRFDEIIHIEHMDEKIVQHYVPTSDGNYLIISKWPIAYIREYCNIRDVLGQLKATQSVPKLDIRQKESNKSCQSEII